MSNIMGGIRSWLILTMSILIIVDNGNCFAGKIKQISSALGKREESGVHLNVKSKYVMLDNGIVKLTIAKPEGFITGIRYNGIENLLELKNEESNRGYFDVVWDAPGRCRTTNKVDCTDRVTGTKFKVVSMENDRIEISFTRKWTQALHKKDPSAAPINVDRRYIMFKGLAGYYSYIVLVREENYPSTSIHQIRAVYKLSKIRFRYMGISDDGIRLMPLPRDRHTGKKLAYKEAVRLKRPLNPSMKGEVDDKYQYACEDKENKLHGWISTRPRVGFWMITPSNEFRTAGPFKQDLTSHTGPTCLQMFHSAHFAGPEVTLSFKRGEPWKKVFGPFLVYLNSNKTSRGLWSDAKRQMIEETGKWPYDFPLSDEFARPKQRGSVSGRLLVNDRCCNRSVSPASNAWVGLAAPGEVGSWQVETKGYQFWVTTGEDGSFEINGVLEGTYNLYATVPGYIGDYKYAKNIEIIAGKKADLGDLTYETPRNGPTLWEIGKPDRTAAEFFVPDHDPRLVNKLFINKPQHKFRQYGLWERYSELYPIEDLVYTVGKSDFHKDWFFAQVTRKNGRSYKPTTWRIVFPMEHLKTDANCTLRLAIASASNAEVQVRFNDDKKFSPDFTTKLFGKDNAIARHGIHGLYRLFSVDVPSNRLRFGNNTIYLTQTRCKSSFEGVMYDYIRLEGPSAGV